MSRAREPAAHDLSRVGACAHTPGEVLPDARSADAEAREPGDEPPVREVVPADHVRGVRSRRALKPRIEPQRRQPVGRSRLVDRREERRRTRRDPWRDQHESDSDCRKSCGNVPSHPRQISAVSRRCKSGLPRDERKGRVPIGAARFELATSCSQSRRANQAAPRPVDRSVEPAGASGFRRESGERRRPTRERRRRRSRRSLLPTRR
jgi:hypothetical protein